MGTLYIPNLDVHGEFIVVNDISPASAKHFITGFAAVVEKVRRLTVPTNAPQLPDAFQEYFLVDGLDGVDIVESFVRDESLTTSNIVGHRGVRAVFVGGTDDEGIIIGTTVVYNRNRAMLGVDDQSIVNTLLNVDPDNYNSW